MEVESSVPRWVLNMAPVTSPAGSSKSVDVVFQTITFNYT